MPEENLERDKKLAASSEMDEFYRSLVISQSNAIARVMADNDPQAIIDRAVSETDRLRTMENDLQKPSPKCQKHEIWDEVLQRCVAI